MEINRSTYYYKAKARNDEGLTAALKKVAWERRRWGYRRLTLLLRRAGWPDNHKRIHRVYKATGLQVQQRKRRKVARWRGAQLATPRRANERWSMDFVHDSTARQQRLRVLNIVDDCTRECLCCEVDTSLPGERVTRVLDRIVAWRGLPQNLLTDNGPEFTGTALDQWAHRHGVTLQFIAAGKPMQNAYIESFNGKFRDECLNEHWFINVPHARAIIERWRQDYNTERPHSSLQYQTPAAFAARCLASPHGGCGREQATDSSQPDSL